MSGRKRRPPHDRRLAVRAGSIIILAHICSGLKLLEETAHARAATATAAAPLHKPYKSFSRRSVGPRAPTHRHVAEVPLKRNCSAQRFTIGFKSKRFPIISTTLWGCVHTNKETAALFVSFTYPLFIYIMNGYECDHRLMNTYELRVIRRDLINDVGNANESVRQSLDYIFCRKTLFSISLYHYIKTYDK